MEKPANDIQIRYIVETYKDMEFANEIVTSDVFKEYKQALDFYNKESINNYLVTIDMTITKIDEKGIGHTSIYTLGNNYKEL